MSGWFQHAFVLAPLLLGLSACEDGGLLGLGGEQCGGAPEVPHWARRTRATAEQAGPATVTSIDPFAVTFDNGRCWTLLSEAPRAIPLGARVLVEVKENGFGLNDQGGKVAVWALKPDETAGKLAFATWYGTKYSALDFGDLSYTTEPTGSTGCLDDCGHQYRSQVYRVRVGQAERLVRQETEVGPYTMSAEGYVDEGSPGPCNDHAHKELYGGRVERSDLTFELDPEPVNCRALSTYACLQYPGCTLFGGEQLPYACRPALQGCERMVDSDLCTDNQNCVWVPGDCYCPDGASCECEGGQAPGCRTACTVRGSDSDCMDSDIRFCEALRPARSDCATDRPGVCRRRPAQSECIGEDIQVCGCSPAEDGQWRRMPACLRAHQGLPMVATSTHCAE